MQQLHILVEQIPWFTEVLNKVSPHARSDCFEFLHCALISVGYKKYIKCCATSHASLLHSNVWYTEDAGQNINLSYWLQTLEQQLLPSSLIDHFMKWTLTLYRTDYQTNSWDIYSKLDILKKRTTCKCRGHVGITQESPYCIWSIFSEKICSVQNRKNFYATAMNQVNKQCFDQGFGFCCCLYTRF